MDKNLHTYNTSIENLDLFKNSKGLLSHAQENNLKSLDSKVSEITSNIMLFNKIYSDHGWCIYDSIDTRLLNSINNAYTTGGIQEGEKILTTYFSSKANLNLSLLKNKSKYFLPRYSLIELAFNDHFAGRYHASIPVFLMIIDGTLNDYSKNKGFFSTGSDLTNWDCLVGCDSALPKIKDIFNRSRKATTTHTISIPYRNGILHGRDINYNNAIVSCKCITLLYALADWMSLKDNEDKRKEKYQKNLNKPTPIELSIQIQNNKMINEEIKCWKKRSVIIGTDVSEIPSSNDCETHPYISPFIDMFNSWDNKNYGLLSNYLKEMFSSVNNDKHIAGHCRTFFENKIFKSYKLIEIEEKSCSLTYLSFEVSWLIDNSLYVELLKFNCRYSSDDQIALPWRNNGNWIIIPLDIRGLYKYY